MVTTVWHFNHSASVISSKILLSMEQGQKSDN